MTDLAPIGSLSIDDIKRFLNSKGFVFSTDSLDGYIQGYHNYGPIGLKIKNHIIDTWRRIFVTDNVFEIETPIVNDERILQRSGHAKRFNDPVITINPGTDKQHMVRADHFVEDKTKNFQNVNLPAGIYTDFDVLRKFILAFALIEEPFEISSQNLMFKTQNGTSTAFLRPELAQSMFVEFKPLYTSYGKGLPFGIAQVGKSYRNEISTEPFTRLREFTQAEVEYFVDPNDITYDSDLVSNCTIMPFLCADDQRAERKTPTKISLADAIRVYELNKHVSMFILKLYKFIERLGLADIDIYRFRQHTENEMAHYATDCWDLEILCDGRWLECAGLAHRGNYDLTNHNIKNSSMVKRSDRTEFIPHVIEPSIGIDRIFFTLMLHKIKHRKDFPTRYVLTTPPNCSLYDVSVAPLSKNVSFVPFVDRVSALLSGCGINCHVDHSSTSIGKRYTRTDEIGIPYVVTIDFDTLNDDTVTLRYRDTTEQIRLKITDLPEKIGKFDISNVRSLNDDTENNHPMSDTSSQSQSQTTSSQSQPQTTSRTRRAWRAVKNSSWTVPTLTALGGVVVGAVGTVLWGMFGPKKSNN